MLFPHLEIEKIVIGQVTSAPGLTLSGEQMNPMYLYRIDQKPSAKQSPYKVMRFTEGRALWRDSSAMLGSPHGKVVHPKSIDWVQGLITYGIIPKRRLEIAAFGMSTDPGKQKVFFYRGEQFVFPDQLMADEDLSSQLQEALDLAEMIRTQLWGAIAKLAGLFLSPDMDLENGRKPAKEDINRMIEHWNPEKIFWAALEIPFFHFLEALVIQPEEVMEQWKAELRSAGLKAFEQTVSLSGNDVKALKAAAKSRVQFFGGLKKVLEPKKEEG
ncbi:MAG: type I-E CRISPR-associated protein Cse1/CasA [Flexilinea sp.]